MGTHSSDFGGRRGRRGCGANALSEVAVIAPEDGGDKSVGATGAGADSVPSLLLLSPASDSCEGDRDAAMRRASATSASLMVTPALLLLPLLFFRLLVLVLALTWLPCPPRSKAQ